MAIGNVEKVVYCYGSLVNKNLNKDRDKAGTYGVGVMQVTAETLWKWAKELPEKLMNKDGIDHGIFIVLGPPLLFGISTKQGTRQGTLRWN